jgi:hypothetical protein
MKEQNAILVFLCGPYLMSYHYYFFVKSSHIYFNSETFFNVLIAFKVNLKKKPRD